MTSVEIAMIATLLVAFAVFSRRIDRWPLTMPMVFVAFGAITAGVDAIDIQAESELIAELAEITLAVILFSDAVRIELPKLRRHLAIPARLLGIGLPLTIAFGALTNSLLFPDRTFAVVALLAAVLAPTDAALGTAVVEDESVPIRDRLSLNVESGVNDGLVVPVVAVLTAIVLDENRTTRSWVAFIAEQIGWGVSIGFVVGALGVTVLSAARRRGWSDGRYEQLATFALPLVALFAADAVGGNSFIAAFVGGLTFGSFHERMPNDDPTASPTSFGEFTEDAAQLLAVGAFFVFGNVLLGQVTEDVSPAVVACAVLTLTVGRMLPVWIAMIGTGLRWPSRLFLGWFGPRGLASIIFGLLLLEDFESSAESGDELFSVIGITVTASVILHGASAAWGARVYGNWSEAASFSDDERDAMHMPSMPDVAVTPRWGTRR